MVDQDKVEDHNTMEERRSSEAVMYIENYLKKIAAVVVVVEV